MNVVFRCLISAVVLTAAADCCSAHPEHFSVAEIEWNPDSARFEVAMRLRIADLEDALSAAENKRVGIESHPQIQQLVQAYLRKHFSVSFEGDTECVFHWVGMETELHDVWVYFEAESRAGRSDSGSRSTKQQPARRPESKAARRWDELFVRSKSDAPQLRPVVIRNIVLFQIQPEQINTVSVKCGRQSETAAFNVKESRRVFGVSKQSAARRIDVR